ncbi:plastocyanin [Methylobacterium sp. A54F]
MAHADSPPSRLPVDRRLVGATLLALLAGLAVSACLVSGLQASGTTVSQKGRAFQPGSLVLARGETVTIVNDDSDLLHHAYIEADGFSFDSGDQTPGSRTPVTFSERGVFQVLCGIHPKMKLVVRVN